MSKKSELLAEATGALGTLSATAVEAHHKTVIAGLLALLNEAPKVIEQEELTVYGYCVVDRDGKFIKEFGQNQQEAIDFADESTENCIDTGIDWDYCVAVIVDQGGL